MLSLTYAYWYFGPVQMMSPGRLTPIRHCASVPIEVLPAPVGSECCCDSSIGMLVVWPVSGGRSWL